MTYLSIQATDTLFFRDGRPFSMSEESFAQGVFPPSPSVLHGALRTTFMSQHVSDTYSVKTGIRDSAQLKLCFIALQKHIVGQAGHSVWLPMPADLLVPSDGSEVFPLQLRPKPAHSSYFPMPEVLTTDQEDETADGTYLIRKSALEDYLSGKSSQLDVKPLAAFLTEESKIGIGRNKDARTAEIGQLFRVQTNRPAIVNEIGDVEKLRIVVGFDDLGSAENDWSAENGWLALGGERRIAHFEQEEACSVKQPEIDTNRFKIYLATPAVFADGWQPKALFAKYGLRLVSAALGRSLPIGGWDLEHSRPKSMLQTVSAGSVYFVEADDLGKAKTAATAIHGKSSADTLNGTDYAAQGFGIAYVGKININV